MPGTHRRSAKSQGSREPTKTQSPSGQTNFPRKVKPSHSRNKVNPVCKPLQPILAVYLFAGGEGTLLTLTFHGSALRLRRKRFTSPYLHPVPIFLSILWNNLFVCDMFFLVLVSLSFFIFFYYFLFATVTLVKKIKDAAQEFL